MNSSTSRSPEGLWIRRPRSQIASHSTTQKSDLPDIPKWVFSSEAEECTLYPKNWIQHGKNCYQIKPWLAHKVYCFSLGSRLLKIDSKEELVESIILFLLFLYILNCKY